MTNKKDINGPDHYKIGDSNLIDSIQNIVDDFGSACQMNLIKYSCRANKKHEDPREDIKKIIRYANYWLNHLDGKKASEPRLVKEETNHQEDFSPFDKLKEMLSPQEQDLIKDKEIVMVRIGHDNIYLDKEDAQELIQLLGGAVYGEDQ